MPIVGLTSYPTIQSITNLARSLVRDDMAGATGTIGEGQILVDNLQTSLTMSNFFNSALQELSKELSLANAPMLIADNYILPGIPPMNGPLGLAVADPSVQVQVSFNGYYDGTQWHSTYALPTGCFQVLRCWERETGSSDTFHDMGEPSNGLAGLNQTSGWGRWEWRQDMVCLPGSLDTRDLRLRYLMILNPVFVAYANPATTFVPIMGCENAMALKIARMNALRQSSMAYPTIKADEMKATSDFVNQQIHRQQGTNYVTLGYGSDSGYGLNRGL